MSRTRRSRFYGWPGFFLACLCLAGLAALLDPVVAVVVLDAGVVVATGVKAGIVETFISEHVWTPGTVGACRPE